MTHNLRTTLGILTLAAALAPSALPAQALPPARQIIDRYIEAVGGEAAVRAPNFRHTVTAMSMPAMGATFVMETFQARPNRILTRMEMGAMGAVATGYDGSVAWTTSAMQGPRVIEGEEIKAMLQQADFEAGFYAPASFPTMETAGESEYGGRPCWDVRMVHVSGMEMRNCFDKETGLLSGMRLRQVSAMGEIETSTRVEDYRDFDGVKIATRMTTQMMGQEMIITVRSVSHEPIDDAVFALPAEIRALVQN